MNVDWSNVVAPLAEAARNLFGAGEGRVHPASALSLGQVVYWWYVNRAVEEAVETGQHPWDILAREFDMTREEFEQYVYDHDYPYQWEDMHELEAWKEAHDPMVQLNKMMGETYGY